MLGRLIEPARPDRFAARARCGAPGSADRGPCVAVSERVRAAQTLFAQTLFAQTLFARTLFARTLLALGLAITPGCVAVAAGGLGVMLSQEFQKGAQIVHYDRDAEIVWVRVKETLAHLSTRQPIFEEPERRAFATVEGGSVRVDVMEAGEGRCRVSVTARRYGLQSPELALETLDAVDAQVRR